MQGKSFIQTYHSFIIFITTILLIICYRYTAPSIPPHSFEARTPTNTFHTAALNHVTSQSLRISNPVTRFPSSPNDNLSKSWFCRKYPSKFENALGTFWRFWTFSFVIVSVRLVSICVSSWCIDFEISFAVGCVVHCGVGGEELRRKSVIYWLDDCSVWCLLASVFLSCIWG